MCAIKALMLNCYFNIAIHETICVKQMVNSQ